MQGESMTGSDVSMFLILFPFLSTGLFVWWMYRYFRLRGEYLSKRVETQLGQITATAYDSHSATLRVLRVSRGTVESDRVGLEVRIPALSDYQRTALTMTHAEARELVTLLQGALALQPTVANDAAVE